MPLQARVAFVLAPAAAIPPAGIGKAQAQPTATRPRIILRTSTPTPQVLPPRVTMTRINTPTRPPTKTATAPPIATQAATEMPAPVPLGGGKQEATPTTIQGDGQQVPTATTLQGVAALAAPPTFPEGGKQEQGGGFPTILPWLLMLLGAGLLGGAFVGLRLLGRAAVVPPLDDSMPHLQPPPDDGMPHLTPPPDDQMPASTPPPDDEMPDIVPPPDDSVPGMG